MSGFSFGQAFLPPPIDHPFPQANAAFGVAESGFEFGTPAQPGLVIGTYRQDVGGVNDQGVVYRYVQSPCSFMLLDTLNHPDPQTNALFGYQVANIGDIDGDDRPDIAVSAHVQDVDGNVDQGRVYLFSGMTGALIDRVDNPVPSPNAYFGVVIETIGLIDGDLVPDFAVGAHGQDLAGTNEAGQVYVFSGVDRSLLYTVDNPDLPDHRPQFGRALAAMGDIDNDCIGDFAVSSPFYGGGPYIGVGRAYVYSGVDGSLLFRVFMPNPEANSIPGTGGKFCNVGDVNGDWI
ncbi:MAG: hypothetical protein GY715_00895, partial [Planctomycetes bacterium]|nr:hypothetical protein [Planctomycetota bacterium]